MCRRLVGLTLLSLFHQCLKAGFNRVFHLLKHLMIEGWSRSSLCGWRSHRCWWFWCLRSRRFVELVELMELEQVVEVGGKE